MRWRQKRTLNRIVRAFAESVEELDFASAEGWFATARLYAGPPPAASRPILAPRSAEKGVRPDPRSA
jgi:hypothetical protein